MSCIAGPQIRRGGLTVLESRAYNIYADGAASVDFTQLGAAGWQASAGGVGVVVACYVRLTGTAAVGSAANLPGRMIFDALGSPTHNDAAGPRWMGLTTGFELWDQAVLENPRLAAPADLTSNGTRSFDVYLPLPGYTSLRQAGASTKATEWAHDLNEWANGTMSFQLRTRIGDPDSNYGATIASLSVRFYAVIMEEQKPEDGGRYRGWRVVLSATSITSSAGTYSLGAENNDPIEIAYLGVGPAESRDGGALNTALGIGPAAPFGLVRNTPIAFLNDYFARERRFDEGVGVPGQFSSGENVLLYVPPAVMPTAYPVAEGGQFSLTLEQTYGNGDLGTGARLYLRTLAAKQAARDQMGCSVGEGRPGLGPIVPTRRGAKISAAELPAATRDVFGVRMPSITHK